MSEMHQLLAWQHGLWQKIAPALIAQRMPHALMLAGAPGVGKHHLALLLAMSLLCAERDAQALPCGQCRSCLQVETGAHPDFVELSPAEGKKSILIDQVRAFSRTLYLRPQYGQARVGFVHSAERLYPNAANALLKTLEEPPAGSHILLVTEQPSAVIATIRSRCQIMRIPYPSADALQAWFAQQPELVKQALPLARGAPLRALALADADVVALQGQWLQDFAALAATRTDPVSLAQRWQGQPIIELLDWLYLTCADLLKRAFNAPAKTLANQKQLQTFEALAERIDTEKLRRALPRLLNARRLADSNADRQLILEQLMITLWACRKAPN